MNKPYLPLASGDFSPALGLALVVLSGAAALAMGAPRPCAAMTPSYAPTGVASNSQPLLLTLVLRCAPG